MKRVPKFCWKNYDEEAKKPDLTESSEEISETPSEPASEPPSESPAEPQLEKVKWNYERLRAKRHNNAFTVTKARFLPDDEFHTVVISLDKEGGTKMTLTVDDTTICQLNTARNPRGNAELDIVGLAIDFSWDLVRIPLNFRFLTREFSFHARPVGSGGGSSRSGRSGKQQKDVKHVYLLEISAV